MRKKSLKNDNYDLGTLFLIKKKLKPGLINKKREINIQILKAIKKDLEEYSSFLIDEDIPRLTFLLEEAEKEKDLLKKLEIYEKSFPLLYLVYDIKEKFILKNKYNLEELKKEDEIIFLDQKNLFLYLDNIIQIMEKHYFSFFKNFFY